MDVDTFVQVSQIAHEAVMDATQHQVPHPLSTTTTGTADASLVWVTYMLQMLKLQRLPLFVFKMNVMVGIEEKTSIYFWLGVFS